MIFQPLFENFFSIHHPYNTKIQGLHTLQITNEKTSATHKNDKEN